MTRRLGWVMVAGAAALAGAALARRGTRAAWRLADGDPPPVDPTRSDVGLKRGLVWTLASATTAASARLLARYAARHAWTQITGRPPPKA